MSPWDRWMHYAPEGLPLCRREGPATTDPARVTCPACRAHYVSRPEQPPVILTLAVWAPGFVDKGTGTHVAEGWVSCLGWTHEGVLWVAPLGSPAPFADPHAASRPGPLWEEIGPVGPRGSLLPDEHPLGRIREAWMRAVAMAQ